MDTNYIMHHGVKGQRWGIRRYQNPDGSYTALGKRHRSIDTNPENWDHNTKAVTGVDDFVLKRGTKIIRVQDSEEQIDDSRKYASFTKNDFRYYNTEVMSPAEHELMTVEYRAIKDLKVAGIKESINAVLEAHGQTPLSDAKVNAIYKAEWEHSKKNGYTTDYGNALKDVVDFDTEWAVKWTLNTNPKVNSKTFKILADKGYDAMIDLEDEGTITDYPIVLLEPKTKQSIAESRRWNWASGVNPYE